MAAPKFPAKEKVWVQYSDEKGNLKFIMTSTLIRDQYMLYELSNDKFVRLGKATSPTELEEKFKVHQLLHAADKPIQKGPTI
jgi:hypothetical protein